MGKIRVITIEQLDESGNAWRTYTLYKTDAKLNMALDAIERAYYMPRTRVTVK